MADGSLALTVAYDGIGFGGSQKQPGSRTVQEELEAALERLAGRAVPTTFAGRTDRGVHAIGQVVGCGDARPDLSPETLRKALNAALADDLAAVRIERKPAGFHARYDARWREYRYRVWSGIRQPAARGQVWQRSGLLDVAEMARAAERLVGERDVAALAGGGEGVPWSTRRDRPRGTTRRIVLCGCRAVPPWWGGTEGTLVEIRVAADGFLPRMVRTIAALVVEVGRGARPVDWVDEVLAGGDRRGGAGTAPAHGLTFWRVGYDDEVPDPE